MGEEEEGGAGPSPAPRPRRHHWHWHWHWHRIGIGIVVGLVLVVAGAVVRHRGVAEVPCAPGILPPLPRPAGADAVPSVDARAGPGGGHAPPRRGLRSVHLGCEGVGIGPVRQDRHGAGVGWGRRGRGRGRRKMRPSGRMEGESERKSQKWARRSLETGTLSAERERRGGEGSKGGSGGGGGVDGRREMIVPWRGGRGGARAEVRCSMCKRA